jgi:hypothetical protein
MKIFKKEFLPNIPPKKISPETVERTLKSWKWFWNRTSAAPIWTELSVCKVPWDRGLKSTFTDGRQPSNVHINVTNEFLVVPIVTLIISSQ